MSASALRHGQETGPVLSSERREGMGAALPLLFPKDTVRANRRWSVRGTVVAYPLLGPVAGGGVSPEKSHPQAPCPASTGFLLDSVLLFASLGLCKRSGPFA